MAYRRLPSCIAHSLKSHLRNPYRNLASILPQSQSVYSQQFANCPGDKRTLTINKNTNNQKITENTAPD